MAIPLYNIRFILLISASFITIFSSIAIYFCLPILISHIIRTQLTLSSNSGSFNDWKLNSVIDRIYLYNITNLDDLLSTSSDTSANNNIFNGNARHSNSSIAKPIPKLQQVGPITFRQDREKTNIRFDTSNETVIYDQSKRWTFLPELSFVQTPEDLNKTWIYHMNLPLAGSTLKSEYAEFINPIVREFEIKLFMNHSLDILLFEGYQDILMEQAKTSGEIDIDKFGWMYNQNNSITRDIRIFTGPSNATLDKFGSVDTLAYMKQFNVWHLNDTEPNDLNNQCNEFRYSSAGEFFPPPKNSFISRNGNNNQQQKRQVLQDKLISDMMNSSKETSDKSTFNPIIDIIESEKTISLFMPDLCRVFKLMYNKTYSYHDLSVDRYIANEFTYDYISTQGNREYKQQANSDTNPNRCYCIYNENTKLTSCPPNGMMDLYTCRKGSPLTVSFPHFLYSNNDSSLVPYLAMFEDNIQPEESEHQFYIDLESSLNIPVKAQIVLQFNVHFKNEPTLNFTRDYHFLFDNPKNKISNNVDPKTVVDFYIPQMWIKSTAEIDMNNLQNLKFIQKHLVLVTPIATCIMFAFASILLIMSAKLAYILTYGAQSTSREQETCGSMKRCEDTNEKQKYYAMQLVGDCYYNHLEKPTTSSWTDDES